MLVVDLKEAMPPAGCPPGNSNCPHAQGTKALGGVHSGNTGSAAIQVDFNHDGNLGAATIYAWMVEKTYWDQYGDAAAGWELTRREEPVMIGANFAPGSYRVEGNMCPQPPEENEGAPAMLIIVMVLVCICICLLIGFLLQRYVLKGACGAGNTGGKGAVTGLADLDAEKGRASDEPQDFEALQRALQKARAENNTLKKQLKASVDRA